MKTFLRISFVVHLTLFVCIEDVYSQYNFIEPAFFSPSPDTLYFEHRTGGKHIDSLDKAYYDLFPTLFNTGRGHLPQFRSLDSWGTYRHYFSDDRPIYLAKHHFTALPYTGFFYSFGSGGEQVLDLRYTQNITKNFNLSFRYHRGTSDQTRSSFFMRNIESNSNDLSLFLHYQKKRYTSSFSAYHGFDNNRENFGTSATPEDLGIFPLEQLPVQNTIATSRIRRTNIQWRNALNLTKDSVNSTFFITKIAIHNFERRYKDSLNSGTFNFWIYDSMNTEDLWEEPHLLLENGLQYKKNKLKLYGGFVIDYFTYFNRDLRINRLDGIIQGAFQYKNSKIKFDNTLRFFILGTPSETNIRSSLIYKIKEQWNVGYSATFERLYPEFFQLHYRGNHIAYDNSGQSLSPTERFYLEGFIAFGKNHNIKLSGALLNVDKLYYFENGNWNFSGSQNVIIPSITWKLKRGVLGWEGSAQYFAGDKSLFFAPDFFISSRLFLDAALFKAKRLKVVTGIEAQLFDGYRTAAYHPELGIFGQLAGIPSLQQQNLLLHAFVNLQMDRFRFFISANRINSLFEEQPSSFVEGYPLRPFAIRIGITWDFVN